MLSSVTLPASSILIFEDNDYVSRLRSCGGNSWGIQASFWAEGVECFVKKLGWCRKTC